MLNDVLFFISYGLTLLFGVYLSAAFSHLRFTKRTHCIFLTFSVCCGVLQLLVFILLNEQKTWELYPLITHLPLALLLILVFKKRFSTVIAAVSLAYLCCQSSKWIRLFLQVLSVSETIVWIFHILTTIIVGYFSILLISKSIAEIFSKDNRSVYIFSIVPLSYYVFDYVVGIYTDSWINHYRVAGEFLSVALCVSFVGFCLVYYKEYEKKIIAEQKEQIFQITTQQQEKELYAIKQSDMETRLLRHDMRLLLSNISLCIENNDKETARTLINGYISQITAAQLHRYCDNDTINYILSNFEGRFKADSINFAAIVEINKLSVDVIVFSFIISNALDNAYNALIQMPLDNRQVKLMLKENDGKVLLSIKNSIKEPPVFVDGMPVTTKKNHGYGTQSIRYMTEKLGGNYQFSVKDDMFVVRIVI